MKQNCSILLALCMLGTAVACAAEPVTTTSLFLGFGIEKGAEPFVTFSIDDGAPQPLIPYGNRPPIANNLAPAVHRIRLEYSGSKAPQLIPGKIRISAVGVAGVKP